MARARSSRSSGIYELFQLAQIALVVGLYWMALGVFFLLYPTGSWIDFDLYLTVSVLVVLALVFTSFVSSEEMSNLMFPNLQMALQASLKRTLAVVFTLLFYAFVTKNAALSRFFLLGIIPFLYLTLFLTHRYLPIPLIRLSFQKGRNQTTLLCGSVARARQLKYWFARKSTMGLAVVGMLTDEGVREVDGIPVLGGMKDLEQVLGAVSVTQVILMHVPEPKADIVRFYELCERNGTRLLMINDLDDIIGHAIVLKEDDGLTFIGVRNEPLENVLNRALKRLLDLALASAVLFLLLPLVAAVVKLCQLFQSPGPLFYRQQRSGLNHQTFEMIKFRTMHIHGKAAAEQATRGDKRVYAAGRLFRRLSLDELPQFWNVLKGEMSTVGPRPHLPEHDKLFAMAMGNYHVRSVVKPGLTGLAQVRGFRGETTTEEQVRARIASDLFYIENWSLAMDVVIILRTVLAVIAPPKTAY